MSIKDENAYILAYDKTSVLCLSWCLTASRTFHTRSEVNRMHTKQTVRYLCHKYPSGNCYYFKEEVITYDSWDNLDSLAWGRRRPITKRTFDKRKKEGYRSLTTYVDKPKGELLYFPLTKPEKKEELF
ncbi:hypothetical protein [Alteribacter populi]|uniref:hypothetical protein n=1 Tax=Alteribacter populi TaxID=2011011 RepID=UPI001E36BC60|nr:hypothetical protein [Alteribacter populi]